MEAFLIPLSIEEQELIKIIEPLLDSEGFELVNLKLSRSHWKSHLALFVDLKAEENAITMESLADISRLLSDVLDASLENEQIFKGRYDLEISSPGLDRPLAKKSHFEKALGKKIKVRLRKACEGGSRNLIGTLIAVHDGGIELSIPDTDEPLHSAFADIADAHIIFEFAPKGQKKFTKETGR